MDSKWIDVKDELPEIEDSFLKQKRVIACWGNDEGNVAEKTYCKRTVRGKIVYRFENSYGGICHQNITHWQPLPTPPNK